MYEIKNINRIVKEVTAMSILMRPKKKNLLLSMSELLEEDYGKKYPELEQMYHLSLIHISEPTRPEP